MSAVMNHDEMHQLVLTFLAEADEFIGDMETGLLALEKNSADKKLIDQVFRAAHSLKGSSMAVGLKEVGSFTHELEAVLLGVKNNQLEISAELISTLLLCNDHIKYMIAGLREDLSASFDSESLVQQIAMLNPRSEQSKKLTLAPGFGFFDDEPDAPAPVLDKGSSFTTDPEESKQNVVVNESGAKNLTGAARSVEQIKVSQDKIDRLVNNIGEMAILLTVLEDQLHGIKDRRLHSAVKQLYKISKDVQDVSISLRMLPVKPVFQKLKRIVRDTASKLNKQVELHTIGEDFEIDKSILDMVSDPLVHIVRNGLDHGIESPEQRQSLGKNPVGSIELQVCYENGRLVFYINDDGAGIDADRVRAKALKLGLIDADTPLSQAEILNLVFHPGFSTKDQVTEVSGRGVGMDVVRTNIQKMSGEIDIRTEPGQGTQIKITLPLTFSIIDGTIVIAAEQRYVIPMSDIQESVRITPGILLQSSTLGEVLTLRGTKLPAFRLDELCEGQRGQQQRDQIAMIIKTQESTCAIIVDEIAGRQPIVIKNMGQEMQDYREFSGSTILGDGKPALIVELNNLIRRSVQKKRVARPLKERVQA